ncbi:uncharacterized protein K460DRAFT_371225 [Cucurbitaria berberidis CBS 394.84]|uniref:C3H1-type domain-containing protein n=1 Tax=Cucurbitaria berberidis CBS 394.84 TaxID=1168544 RepID=A0A9P4G8S9_9PLEO|nr:uncharacterized protein K460DRAFT_371225 [Cucurbitaria berberidis CBS 394.84]KAF1841213.1 hypothetical protein K460DRAFT_371225 [Cucurbitaria berberidis CBS 394.84]
MPPRLSPDFKRGRCRFVSNCPYGTKCRFSHGTAPSKAIPSSSADPQPRKESEIEGISREWTYMTRCK